MARTDIHSPLHLVTEDYEFWGDYDAESHGTINEFTGEFHEGEKARIHRIAREQGLRWANVHEHGGDQCDHCGAYLRYVGVLQHTKTKELIKVGETCLANRFEKATAAFHAMRKAAELDREKMRIKTAREEYFTSNPDIRPIYERFVSWTKGAATPEFEDTFLQDLMRKLHSYGSLSEKQTPWVKKCIDRFIERQLVAAKRAEEKATIADVEEGTYEFSGTVVAIKLHESDFGSSFKMTVKADDGRVYWGTVPRSLEDWWDANTDPDEGYFTGIAGSDNPCGVGERNGVGVKVTIKAAVTKSDKDRTFGFFKRPRLISAEKKS